MVDQNTFTETIREVAEIIRTSAEPMSREEILGYFKDMELNTEQENMVLEFLLTPHEEPEEEETEESKVDEAAEKEEEEAEEMEGIVDCRIFLPGGKEIRGEADVVTEEKQNVEEADVRMQIPDIDKEGKMNQKPESEERQIKKSEEWKETKQKSKSEECQMKKPESKSEERQIKKPESESEVAPGDEERSQEMQNKSRVETKESRKESEIPENQVLYIQDLTQLLSMGEKQRELYYNSFLLHGYYQYRHVVAGDGFIGVPGNFSQREAIAAKMMGFPLFIEAENLQHCEIGEESRAEMPQIGAYGYFLCKVR